MTRNNAYQLLILGGTSDGRHIAEVLCRLPGFVTANNATHSVAITYSVAGLVRIPQLSCKVISGGFSQFGGLRAYIKDHQIDAVLDMTHPYAQRISLAASQATAACGIAYWRYQRPAWQPMDTDNWHECAHWPSVLSQLTDKSSILLAAGQLPAAAMIDLQSRYLEAGKTWVLRTAVKPSYDLPPGMHWIKAIGPFSESEEMALMQQYGIDALVCKNSGGSSTVAKLCVARKLGISVYMLARPPLLAADQVFTDLEQCKHYVCEYFHSTTATAISKVAYRYGQS